MFIGAMRTLILAIALIAAVCSSPAAAQTQAPTPVVETGSSATRADQTSAQVQSGSAAPAAGNSTGGNVAWVLMATVLVLMMGFPGIALFYSGLSRPKNSVNAFMQTMGAVALGSLAFLFIGFGVAFLPGNALIGVPAWPSSWIELSSAVDKLYPGVPIGLFAMFQLAFAAVTVAILLGAWVERVRFPFVLAFVPLWVIVVYSPVARWVWSEHGWLHQLGAIDFAGGTVVHVSSGFSALALALVLGKRHGFGKESFEPNNTALVALGAAFLIVGWYGFNAGSALAADSAAVRALVNTHAAACAGVAVWITIELITRGFTTLIGVLTGAIGALVAVTPASGYVTPEASVLIGALGAGAAWLGAVMLRRLGMFDDSLDVFGVHGLAGIAGSLATGLLAVPALAPGASFGAQMTATLVVAVYAFIATATLAVALQTVLRARVSSNEEKVGLDTTYHGEPA